MGNGWGKRVSLWIGPLTRDDARYSLASIHSVFRNASLDAHKKHAPLKERVC